MRYAIISDIHANIVALEAVLAHLDEQGELDGLLCLGDVIGYGPDPIPCVDLVEERCDWSLMGNHDFGVVYEPTNFNPGAAQAAFWTRAQLENATDENARRRRLDFLTHMRVRVKFGQDQQYLAVHGSPRRPVNEYIFPDDAINATLKIQQIFERIDHYAFVGHSHVPGVFTDEPDFYDPRELKGRFKFQDGEKCIVNAGSVGQPRDGDPRASYIILDDEGVTFHRVEYNIDPVAEKIRSTPELNDWLGERLYEGR